MMIVLASLISPEVKHVLHVRIEQASDARAKVLSEGETERLREGFLALDRALDGIVD